MYFFLIHCDDSRSKKYLKIYQIFISSFEYKVPNIDIKIIIIVIIIYRKQNSYHLLCFLSQTVYHDKIILNWILFIHQNS